MEWKDELDKRLGQEGDRVALGLLGAGGHVHLFRHCQELPTQPRLCPGADSEERDGFGQLGWDCSCVSQWFLPGSREDVAVVRKLHGWGQLHPWSRPWLWPAPSTVPSVAVASSIHGPVHGCGQLHPRFSPGLFHLHREKPKVLRRGQRSLYSGADAPEGRVECIASSRAGPFMRCPPSLSVT